MSDREVVIGMKFIADLSAARAQSDAFIKELQSKAISLPINTASGGSNGSTQASTLGGLTTTLNGGATASPNFSIFFSQLGNQISGALSQGLSKFSSPGPGLPIGSASPNLSYYFGQQQQALQNLVAQASPNYSYLFSQAQQSNGGGGGGGSGHGAGSFSRGKFIAGAFALHEVGDAYTSFAQNERVGKLLARDENDEVLRSEIARGDKLQDGDGLTGLFTKTVRGALIAILAGYGAATKSIQDVILRVDEQLKDA